MNKLQRVAKMFGKEFADSFEEELEQYPGTPGTVKNDFTDAWLEPSGSAYVSPGEEYMAYGSLVTGTFDGLDQYILTGYKDKVKDLWKCHCGSVHKFPDVLECEKCGAPIREDSRFVLE